MEISFNKAILIKLVKEKLKNVKKMILAEIPEIL